MSIKIYYAYRFKLERWVNFIDLIHDQMMDSAIKFIKREMKRVPIDREKYERDIKKYGTTKLKQAHILKWAQFDAIIKLCIQATRTLEKGLYDINCGVNFWMYKKYVYAIPICPDWMKKDLEFPKWVEDFCYWNNTDPPEKISNRQWDIREKTWNEINCGIDRADHNSRRLYHGVIDLETQGTYVSETDLQLKIFPRQK